LKNKKKALCRQGNLLKNVKKQNLETKSALQNSLQKDTLTAYCKVSLILPLYEHHVKIGEKLSKKQSLMAYSIPIANS